MSGDSDREFDALAAILAARAAVLFGGQAEFFDLTEKDVAYLDATLLDEHGLVRVLPAAALREIKVDHLRFWLHARAIYTLPSVELIDWLKTKIGGRSAIEIGSGNGAVARALGIQGTDNFCQTWPDVKLYYETGRQPTVAYGKDVVRLDALKAISAYKPKVVVACWVTHLFRDDESERGGNMYGVDEDAVIDSVECYIHVGATSSHSKKRVLARKHEELRPDWLFGRGAPQDRVIWWWGK